jgi:hypothetical protein
MGGYNDAGVTLVPRYESPGRCQAAKRSKDTCDIDKVARSTRQIRVKLSCMEAWRMMWYIQELQVVARAHTQRSLSTTTQEHIWYPTGCQQMAQAHLGVDGGEWPPHC